MKLMLNVYAVHGSSLKTTTVKNEPNKKNIFVLDKRRADLLTMDFA